MEIIVDFREFPVGLAVPGFRLRVYVIRRSHDSFTGQDDILDILQLILGQHDFVCEFKIRLVCRVPSRRVPREFWRVGIHAPVPHKRAVGQSRRYRQVFKVVKCYRFVLAPGKA